MLIRTTGGSYTIVQKDTDPDVLCVHARDQDAAQIALDTLEMLFGSTPTLHLEPAQHGTEYPYWFEVGREAVAQWVAAEIRDYLVYTIEDDDWVEYGKIS